MQTASILVKATALSIATHTSLSQSNVLPASSTQEGRCVPSDVPLEGFPPSAVLLIFATSNFYTSSLLLCSLPLIWQSDGLVHDAFIATSSGPSQLLITASTQDCQSSRSASSVVRQSVEFLICATSTTVRVAPSSAQIVGENEGMVPGTSIVTRTVCVTINGLLLA